MEDVNRELFKDARLTHDKLVEIANVSATLRKQMYVDMVKMLVKRFSNGHNATISSLCLKKYNAFISRLDRNNFNLDKLIKEYVVFKNSYLAYYEVVTISVNMLLVNTEDLAPFSKCVSKLYKHNIITTEELNVLRLFNQFRNLMVHNHDGKLTTYLYENRDILTLSKSLIESTIEFFVRNTSAIANNGMYMEAIINDTRPPVVYDALLRKHQIETYGTVLGTNIQNN